VENLFLHTLVFSFLLPGICSAVVANRTSNTKIAVVVLLYSMFFLVYNLLFDSIERGLGSRTYYYIYTIVEYSAFSFLILKSDRSIRLTMIALTLWIGFIIYCTTMHYNKSLERMDALEIAIETIFVLFCVIYFFYLRFKQVDEHYLYQDPFFWFMTGMLVYLGHTFFFNLLVNHVDNEVIKNYYHYSYIGDIIKNLLFTVGLFYLPSKKESTSRSNFFNAPNLDLI